MSQKTNWYHWLALMFREFIVETMNKPLYEIVNIYECKKTGYTKAIVKLSERHTIEKNISDIVVDNEFIENLDKQTIRTLTYMATIECLKPDYSIVAQHMSGEVDEYILEIKSKHAQSTTKKTPSDVSKDPALIARFKPTEANRIGYMAGLREAVREYQLIRNKN